MLLEAGLRVMAERGYDNTSVSDILAEAGLSTRSFYRQFDSKDALLLALIERERKRVAAFLAAAVARTEDPVAGVLAWIDASLELIYSPEIGPLTQVFTTPAVLETYTLGTSYPDMERMYCPPLIKALRAGHRARLLYSPQPEEDAHSIHALIQAVANARQRPLQRRSLVKAQVLRFVSPAIGIAT